VKGRILGLKESAFLGRMLSSCVLSPWAGGNCVDVVPVFPCAKFFVEMKPKHKGWSAPGLTANHLCPAVYA